MKTNDLREALAHLHAELRTIKEVDGRSGEILKRLDQDIRRILENSGDIPDSHHKNLLQTLQDAVVHFETSHPKLTSVMSRLINDLSGMGI
jgi:hypothetical protein